MIVIAMGRSCGTHTTSRPGAIAQTRRRTSIVAPLWRRIHVTRGEHAHLRVTTPFVTTTFWGVSIPADVVWMLAVRSSAWNQLAHNATSTSRETYAIRDHTYKQYQFLHHLLDHHIADRRSFLIPSP
jgi:hypothetical protein